MTKSWRALDCELQPEAFRRLLSNLLPHLLGKCLVNVAGRISEKNPLKPVDLMIEIKESDGTEK